MNMANYSYSLNSERPFIHIRDTLIRSNGKHNSLMFLAPLILGSVGILSMRVIGMQAMQVAGVLLNWTIITVSISIAATACLAIFIAVVDCGFVALKLVEGIHLGKR
jgi:NO-binding membrane sensor protein with MHYT domain